MAEGTKWRQNTNTEGTEGLREGKVGTERKAGKKEGTRRKETL